MDVTVLVELTVTQLTATPQVCAVQIVQQLLLMPILVIALRMLSVVQVSVHQAIPVKTPVHQLKVLVLITISAIARQGPIVYLRYALLVVFASQTVLALVLM